MRKMAHHFGLRGHAQLFQKRNSLPPLLTGGMLVEEEGRERSTGAFQKPSVELLDGWGYGL